MIAGIVLGAVFMWFSLNSKSGRDKTIVYLNLVVLFLSLNNLQICLVDNRYLEVNFFVRKMLIPYYMLILPWFYTFLMHYLKVENKVYSFVRLSVIFFLVEVGVRCGIFPFFINEKESYIVARYSQFEEIFNAIFTIFLFIKSAILVFGYSNRFDFVTSYDNLRWLKNFIFLGCLVMLLWVCAILINLDNVVYPEIFVYYPMRLSCAIILYWIAYQGFFNYRVMTDRIALREQILKTDLQQDEIVEITSETAKKEATEKQFREIENFMQNNDFYLQPDFNLQKLSYSTGIPVNKLSFAINNCSDFNFSDYVSQFRINRAKNLLTSTEFNHYDITSIGLECGFTSKSAFYTAFKKFVGITPAQFKKDFLKL
jgi:AraC-like DNA-binding protein